MTVPASRATELAAAQLSTAAQQVHLAVLEVFTVNGFRDGGAPSPC